jgi:hypothetical protein
MCRFADSNYRLNFVRTSTAGSDLASRRLAGGSDMSSQDLEYYRERARTERALADAYGGGQLTEIHLELAKQYETLIAKMESPASRNAPRG